MADSTKQVTDEEVKTTEEKAPDYVEFTNYGDKMRAETIVRLADSNLQSYLTYLHDLRGYSTKKLDEIERAYRNIAQGISDGSIYSRGAGLKWKGTNEVLNEEIKNGFDPVGIALHFLGPIVDKVNDYYNGNKTTTDPNKPSEAKSNFNASEFLMDYISKTYFNGTNPTESQLRRFWKYAEDGTFNPDERASRFKELIPGLIKHLDNYEFTQSEKEDLTNKLNAVGTALSDGFQDEDFAALDALGLDATNLFKVKTVEKTEEEKAKEAADLKAAEELAAAEALAEEFTSGWEEYIKPYKDHTHYKYESHDVWNGNYKSTPKTGDNYVKATQELGESLRNKGFNASTNKIKFGGISISFVNILEGAYKTKDALWDNGDGTYYIPNSLKGYDGSGWVAKRVKEGHWTLTKKKAEEIPALLKYFSSEYKKKYQSKQNQVPGHEGDPWYNFLREGGVLKFSDGGGIASLLTPEQIEYLYNYYAQSQQQAQPAEQQLSPSMTFMQKMLNAPEFSSTLENNSERITREGEVTEEEVNAFLEARKQEAGEHGYDNYDKYIKSQQPLSTGEAITLASSAMLDIGSMIAASVGPETLGAGTVVSAGLGTASSFAQFGMEWHHDGLDFDDFKHLGMNLGGDLLGLIPVFGSAAKTKKVGGVVLKLMPWVLGVLGTVGTGAQVIDAVSRVKKKLENNQDLNTEDWLSIYHAFKGVLSIAKMGVVSAKQSAMVDRIATQNSLNVEASILTKNGKALKFASKDQYEQFKAASVDGKNAILKQLQGYADGDELVMTSGLFGKMKFDKSSLTAPQTTTSVDLDWDKLNQWSGGRGAFGAQYGRNADGSFKWWTDAGLLLRNMNFTQGIKDFNFGNPYRYQAPPVVPTNRRGGILYAGSGVVLTDSSSKWYLRTGKDIFNELNNRIKYFLNNSSNKDETRKLILRLVNGSLQHHYNFSRLWGHDDDYYENPDVGIYQTVWHNRNNGKYDEIIFTGAEDKYRQVNPLNKRSTRGDNPTNWEADNKFAQQTEDRRFLGKEGDYNPDEIDQINKELNESGFEMYLDKNTKYYKLALKTANGELDTSEDGTNVSLDEIMNSLSETPIDNGDQTGENNGEFSRAEGKEKDSWNMFLKIARNTNLYSLEKSMIPPLSLAAHLKANRENFDTIYPTFVPTLFENNQTTRKVTGNLPIDLYYNTIGAQIMNQGTTAISADPNFNAAREFEAWRTALPYMEKGKLADYEQILKSSDSAQAKMESNLEERNTLSKEDLSNLNTMRTAKAQFKAEENQADNTSYQNFLQQIYYDASKKEVQQNAFAERMFQALHPSPDRDPEVIATQQAYNKAYKEGDYDKITAAANAYNEAYYRAAMKYSKDYADFMSQYNGLSIPIFSSQGYAYEDMNVAPYARYKKDGGKIEQKERDSKRKIRQKDNELFHKNMRHKKTEDNKNRRHASSAIHDLIKKAQ